MIVNLLPWREQERQQRIRQFYLLLASSCLLALLVSGLTDIYIQSQTEKLNHANQLATEQLSSLRTKTERWQQRLRAETQRAADRQQLALFTKQARGLVQDLDKLAASLAKDLWLTDFEYANSTIVLHGLSRSENALNKSMKALDKRLKPQSSVIQSLKSDTAGLLQFELLLGLKA